MAPLRHFLASKAALRKAELHRRALASSHRAMIEIDFAEPTDALELRALLLDAFTPLVDELGYRPSPMDRRFTEALECFFALKARVDGDRAAGFAITSPMRARLYVDALAVDPRRRRQGVGLGLMSAVERLAGELCLPAVELNTDPRLEDALGFYRSAGYQEVSRGRFSGRPTVLLRKRVPTRIDQITGRAPKDARA